MQSGTKRFTADEIKDAVDYAFARQASIAQGRWKTQTKLHDEENGVEGNCTQAAIASILGMELPDVPDFNTLHQHDEHAGFYWDHIEKWCAEKGWQFIGHAKNFQPDGYYLADGPSPRGRGHFVVMQGGKMVHDPHPSRAGIRSIRGTWMLLPLDPARFTLTQ